MGRGPVVLPVRIGTCLWLLGRQLCLRSHHDGADGNPSLYRGLAAFAHRKPAPASSASQFRQFALVHRVKMSSRNARFRDQHSAREMTALRAQSGHLRSEKVVPPLPHVGHFRSNPHAGLELHRLTGTSAMYFAMKCLEQAVVLASKSILRLAFAGGGIT